MKNKRQTQEQRIKTLEKAVSLMYLQIKSLQRKIMPSDELQSENQGS